MARICLVTYELQDIAPTGGIGTATQHLAKWLVRFGYEVTVLFTNFDRMRSENIASWKEYFFNKYGFNFHTIESTPHQYSKNPYPISNAAVCLLFFQKEPPFDLVLFHEMTAIGFFCFKNSNVLPCFANTRMGCITHSPTYWIYERNAQPHSCHQAVMMADMERACVEMADFVISPSQYLIDWMSQRGWQLPEKTHCIPNLLEDPHYAWSVSLNEKQIAVAKIDEIVFFGRLDARKGINVFLDAIGDLPDIFLETKTITLLGEYGYGNIDVENIKSKLVLLEKRCKAVQHITDFDATEARQYLKDRACLAIMPSFGDNSPSVIYECLADRVPFLSSCAGGQRELIDSQFHDWCLFEPTRSGLVEAIESFFSKEHFLLPVASKHLKSAVVNTLAVIRSELDFVKFIDQIESDVLYSPIISVVVACKTGTDFANTLKSIANQTYSNVEILCVHSGLETYINEKNVLPFANLSFFSVDACCTADMYNAAMDYVCGEYVVFLDTDHVLYPEYLESCLFVAQNDKSAAVVTAISSKSKDKCSEEEKIYISLGFGSQGSFYAFSAVHNECGGGAVFVRSDIAKTTQFFAVREGSQEVWSFLLDIHLQGQRISAIPTPFQEVPFAPPIFDWTTHRIEDYKSRAYVLEKHCRKAEAQLSELVLFSINAKQHRIWVLNEERKRLEQGNLGFVFDSHEKVASEHSNFESEPIDRHCIPYKRRSIKFFLSVLCPKIVKQIQIMREARYIRKSGFFSNAWYLENYPDVRISGHDPLLHYMLHGWKEGRNPTATFNQRQYLAGNPDVLQANVNPFLHYILHGRFEGRCI